jgi:hypothetical protein
MYKPSLSVLRTLFNGLSLGREIKGEQLRETWTICAKAYSVQTVACLLDIV